MKNKFQIGKRLEVEKFIYGITHEIWENKSINSINNYYAKDVIVRAPNKTTFTCKEVIDATKNTLIQFPNRQLIGEDVIWSGDLKKGILSSHRILSTATHEGDGYYGKATMKNIIYRVIADCFLINDKVVEEWIVRDETAIINQLGTSVRDFVKVKIKNKIFNGDDLTCIYNAFNCQNYAKHNLDEFTKKYSSNFQKLIDKDFSDLEKYYERSAQTYWPGGKIYYSYNQIKQIWFNFLYCFENLQLNIHNLSSLIEPMTSPRVALRWTINGKHSNEGIFDKPTQKNIEISGISHIEFGRYGIKREYVIFDEISIWKQILL